MAKTKAPMHRYLLVPLEALLQTPHMQYMMWPSDPEKWAEARSLLYHTYAVSEHHENIAIIAVYLDKAEWMNLNGDHQNVRPLI